MKKKDADNKRNKILRAFAHVLLALAGLCGLAYMFLLWLAYESHFYDDNEIIATCRIWHLESTDFCTLNYRMKLEDLEEALETVYLSQGITYTDIVSSIEQRIVFNWGECEGMTPNRIDLCPEPERCSTNYSCYNSDSTSHGARIYMSFSSDGELIGISSPPPGS